MMNKTIPVFDEAGNYIKDVFPRYAIQSIGVSFSVRDAMNKLIALFPNDPYARYKAAGALGGASNHGCLSLDNNGVWIRIK